MPMHATVAAAAQRLLTQLVARINAQLPAANGRVSQFQHLGRTQVCASFLQSVTAETLDLCVTMAPQGHAVTLAADVVRGGSGEILSELNPIVMANDLDLAAALRTLEGYVREQIDTIVEAVS